MLKHVSILAGSLLCAALPLSADVKMTSTNTGQGLGAMINGETVTWVKGPRMRIDRSGMPEGRTTTIMDAAARLMTTINHDKRTAEITDMAAIGAQIEKSVAASDVKAQVTPNGSSKTLLGKSCAGYDLLLTVPMTLGNQPNMAMIVSMTGHVWIAKGAPGTADYEAFWKAAAQGGLFFGNPQQMKVMPAQSKGLTEMYKAMASLGGLAYATDLEMKFQGNEMMAGMMGKMGFTMNSVATAVSTDPFPDTEFAVPAGYKTSNK